MEKAREFPWPFHCNWNVLLFTTGKKHPKGLLVLWGAEHWISFAA